MRPKGENWDIKDIETLKELYKTNSIRKVSKIMNKSEMSVKNAISRFNIKCGDSKRIDMSERRYWTKDDIEKLKYLVSLNTPVNIVSDELDRSIASIYDMSRRINLNYGNPKAPLWSEEEDSIIKSNENISLDDLKLLIPNRSRHAIQGRRSVLKVRKTSFKSGYKFVGKSNRAHNIVMIKKIGRPLKPGEHVHHIDCNKINNDINNLYLTNGGEHRKMHNQLNNILSSLLPELLKSGKVYFEDGIYKTHNDN